MKADHAGTRKLLYSMAKNYRNSANEQTYAIKDEDGQLLVQPDDISKRWKEYFDQLLNVQGNEDLAVYVDLEVDLEEVIEDITGSEILGAVSRMKRGKATGDDDLPVENVKEAGDEAQKLLLTIMQNAYRQKTVPEEWQKGIISQIFKKEDKALCENFRGISFLSH